MPRLTLVIPDLYPARQSLEAQAGLPRLPSLERWLARARSQPMAGDWRDWLLAQHAPAWRAAGPAAVAARAHAAHATHAENVPQAPSAAAGRAWWLATPVQFIAGLDTLRLHPEGLLVLPWAEQQALAGDFARVFAGSGWQLVATGRRELLLLGPAAGAGSSDPARWLGADPAAGLPTGPGSAPLRRLGAELEMWLHEHAVNRARAARGERVATALWLWGAGDGVAPVAAAPADARRAPTLHGADAFLDGLAAVTGAAPPVDAPDAGALEGGGGNGDGDTVVVLGGGALLTPARLAQWEGDWFAPALRQWQAGRWQALTLACGQGLWHAQGGPLAALRGWRAAAPWWQRLLAC
ncbi:MAG: hypothetical protein RL684_2147 [Pseudomonadota bacterium]